MPFNSPLWKLASARRITICDYCFHRLHLTLSWTRRIVGEDNIDSPLRGCLAIRKHLESLSNTRGITQIDSLPHWVSSVVGILELAREDDRGYWWPRRLFRRTEVPSKRDYLFFGNGQLLQFKQAI